MKKAHEATKRHPASVAWDAWIQSIHGKKLAAGEATGQYLRNRLLWAFMAGWDAANGEDAKESR